MVEYRYGEGERDRTPSQVAELVQLKVDVLVVRSLPAIRAAKQATKTIPIVMVTTQDPVATGLIDSLARPGGNITGLTGLTRELSGKRLELLKEAVPGISRVGVLGEASASVAAIAFKDYEAAARALKMQFLSLEVRGPNPDYEEAFQAAAKGRCERDNYGYRSADRKLLKADCGPCPEEPTAFNARGNAVRRGRWPHVLFIQRYGKFQACGHLCRQNSKRRKARRPPCGAADKVRADHQSENGEADRPDDSTERAVPGG
jgi:hypothetical protein